MINLKREIVGTIVESVVESIGDTKMKDGFITIRTGDNELIKIDIGSYTTFDTLKEDAKVRVETDYFETGDLYATKVIRVK